MRFKQTLISILLVLMTITVFSDGGFFRIADPIGPYMIRSDMQRAAILYDEENNEEKLILQIVLNSELDQVGWIIALPSMPQMYEWEHEDIFEVLNNITNKALSDDDSKRPGCVGMVGGCSASGGDGLYFHETITVGQLDLTPIQAENSEALITWLVNNEVSFADIDEEVKTELRDIMDTYIQNNWVFIYGKFNIEQGYYGNTQLLTFDFDVGMPFYPMQLTKIQQKIFHQDYLDVRLWLIADDYYRFITIKDNQPAPYNEYVGVDYNEHFSIEPGETTQKLLELDSAAAKQISFFSFEYSDSRAFEDIWFATK